ncbi:MAG TPA: M23 family metallopeptidase [Gemmatimonadales bacterium]|jgi:murein DD-endopeptidase MepM/ murein hydrolase activator NlpD|nr:M23 family metallopeptidase [Gemmatimonadales bacterium]
MAWRASHYVVAGGLAVTGLLWAAHEAWSARRTLTARPLVVTEAYDDRADTLRARETLSDLLARAGITGRDYVAFLRATKALDSRRLRPGLVFKVRGLRGDSVAQRVGVRTGPEVRVWMNRMGGDSGWRETVETIPWNRARLLATGVIQTNLYDALDRAVPDSFLPGKERVSLAWAIADVYDWEVDFTRDIRPGDRFEVLIERLESPEGERRFGRILAARVDVAATPSYAFYFEGETARGGFYDDKGRSLRRAFLRAPLQYRRISSRFGGRYHPILNRWRSHQGTDYAAAWGTPVRATADGSVTFAGREGGYGNLIEIRHANGIRTRYGHLSKFAKGLRIGQRVTQDQTIGYVGSTGLSTGPHLHYEFLVNGRATNPQRKDAGPVQAVPSKLKPAFESLRGQLLAELEPRPAPAPRAGAVAARVD